MILPKYKMRVADWRVTCFHVSMFLFFFSTFTFKFKFLRGINEKKLLKKCFLMKTCVKNAFKNIFTSKCKVQ